MKFLVQAAQKKENGFLVYRSEEYSFDIEPFEGGGVTSIMVNDIQLEINDDGVILYVWGYCPLIKYAETNEMPQNYIRGTLMALLDDPPVPGISCRINEKERWSIYINKPKGWVCVGDPNTKDRQMVGFAPSCIATLENQELVALWLQPEVLPN